MTEIILFASAFVLVFALGFQSLNVNGGHYLAAALTSFVIGSAQMLMLKLGPDASVIEILAFLCGGPLGIVTAMRIHPLWVRRRRARDAYLNINSGADRP